ncbi:LysR family transcriptional regulator [Rhodobacteraceae bacterium]|nr:LysR family transcriptional regulator [Paracoccaceae bacterium]
MQHPQERLPQLHYLRTFEVLARHLNFTLAGEEIGISQAAVSQQVKALEAQLGVTLVIRGRKACDLTPAGRKLAGSVATGFEGIRQSVREIRMEHEHSLRLSVLPSFAAAWLTERLSKFQAMANNPPVRILADTDQNLDRSGCDVGIWAGVGQWPGLSAELIFPMAFTPMCSPEFLHKYGPIVDIDTLLSAPLIASRDPWWRLWLIAAGHPDREVPNGPDITLDAQNLEATAAIRGQGVALLTPAVFHREIAEGRLVRLSSVFAQDGRGYWIVYPPERANGAKIRKFREWLSSEAKASERSAQRLESRLRHGEHLDGVKNAMNRAYKTGDGRE